VSPDVAPGVVPPASTRRRVASNTAVQLAGKGAILAMGAVSITVVTRYLGPELYGKYSLALLYTQLFGVVADVGLYTTLVRDISRDPSRTEELVGNVLVLRLALAIAVIAVGAGISLALPYDREVRVAIVLAGGPLLFGMLTSSIEAVFQSRLRMTPAVIADVLGRAVALGLVVVVVVADLGFYSVMLAAGGGALVAFLATWRLSRPLLHVRPAADLRVWRTLLAASIPLGVALAINQLYVRADTLIISLFEPYDQVALYTLAYRILELSLLAGSVFLITLLPVMSHAVAHDDARAQRVIRDATDVLVVLGAPLVAGGLVLAPQIVDLAGGDEFAGAAEPLQILLVAGALIWVNGVFGAALIAKDRQASALWLNVAALIFNLGLNLALVPAYGIVVAAVITVASELLILAGSVWLMRRYLGFFPVPRTLVPAVVAAAAMAGLLVLVGDAAPLPVLVVLGIVAYGLVLAAISPASRRLLEGLRP
jgi:O-antigen/teichoic acid export membrane protein